MAAFTLFPAETRVKLTLRQRAAMIAPMRSRVACVAVVGLVAAAGCNEGLSPTPACPRGFVGICGTATVRGTLPDSTQGLFTEGAPHRRRAADPDEAPG